MQVSDYQFYRIVGTCDTLVKYLLPMLVDLRTSDRIAYTVYAVDYRIRHNVSVVVGIPNDSAEPVAAHMAYIGYVMARYDVVPMSVSQFSPPADVDLTLPSCFMDNLPF